MRVIVTGSRTFDNYGRVAAVLDRIQPQPTVIVHGDCPTGVDKFASAWARVRGIKTEAWPPDWTRYGKAAGPRRNQVMVNLGADLCVHFPGGKGTADCVKRALKAGIPLLRG